MNILITILLILSAFTGQAPAPMSAPIVEQVEQTPIPAMLGLEWLPYELALSGAVVPENVAFTITSDQVINCGAMVSEAGVGGCTTWEEDGSVLIAVSPELEWTAWGNHILHHELGHAVLYTDDECAVETYAHHFTTATLWSYPECAA